MEFPEGLITMFMGQKDKTTHSQGAAKEGQELALQLPGLEPENHLQLQCLSFDQVPDMWPDNFKLSFVLNTHSIIVKTYTQLKILTAST